MRSKKGEEQKPPEKFVKALKILGTAGLTCTACWKTTAQTDLSISFAATIPANDPRKSWLDQIDHYRQCDSNMNAEIASMHSHSFDRTGNGRKDKDVHQKNDERKRIEKCWAHGEFNLAG